MQTYIPSMHTSCAATVYVHVHEYVYMLLLRPIYRNEDGYATMPLTRRNIVRTILLVQKIYGISLLSNKRGGMTENMQ